MSDHEATHTSAVDGADLIAEAVAEPAIQTLGSVRLQELTPYITPTDKSNALVDPLDLHAIFDDGEDDVNLTNERYVCATPPCAAIFLWRPIAFTNLVLLCNVALQTDART
jgi:hypothetical protein